MATVEELLRAAMNADAAGDAVARDGLVKAAEAMMAPAVAQTPPRADAPQGAMPPRRENKFGDTIFAELCIATECECLVLFD